jgi:hypothetical protein
MIMSDPRDDSENQAQSAVLRFATKILRPVVRILLRYGLSCNELQELCRWLYVDEAIKRSEFWGSESPSKSHIATVTGLSRKAVLHYSHYQSPDALVAETPGNRASRVQRGWLKDPRYLEDDGTPLAIPFTAVEAPSFSHLVDDYSGDVTPRAVLSELERVGAVEVTSESIRLTQISYLPADENELLDITGMSAGDLLATIHHNLETKARNRYFQRELYYPLVPAERVGELRRALNSRLKPIMEQLYNDVLQRGDPEPQPGAKYKRVGIGVYYFQ